MMKNNRLIVLLTAVGVLLAALVFTILEQDTMAPRYHQHLEQPSEAELGLCGVCGGQGELCTHLPIIRIETGGQKIPGAAILNDDYRIVAYEQGDHGEDLIPVSVSTVEKEGVWHHGGDPADLSSAAMIRYRGNSSRAFSKHSIAMKLVQDDDPLRSRDLPLLGMSQDNDWVLHGPFLDKTLLRNYMWMNISAEIMGYAPSTRFCELIVDGEYQGVYVLMEAISEGANQVDLTDYTPGDAVCSYMVRIGSEMNPLKIIDSFTLYTLRTEPLRELEVIYPTTQDQSQQVHEYVSADFSEIERMLYSESMNDRSELYRDYLDVNSLVNYYILQEFLAVNDSFSNSTYFYKDVRGKLHIGPVWDYNNVLDNFLRPIEMDELILAQRGWYGQLMQDPAFVDQVIDRYRELRKGILSEERLNAYLDDTVAWLGTAVDRNYEVWGYTFDIGDPRLVRVEFRQPPLKDTLALQAQVREEGVDSGEASRRLVEASRPYNPKNYEEAIDWMRTAMNQRGAWMDAHIESLRQYCADSKNAARIDR